MSESEFSDFHTLESYIASQQGMHPDSRGLFSNLLRRIGLASKLIHSKVQKAGLLNILGQRGVINVQGEQQMKLDSLSNEIMKATLRWMPAIGGLASEEESEPVCLEAREEGDGEYVVLFDPLDGSSNIDANIPVGTIFAIHRRTSSGRTCDPEDFLQPGRSQVAAGYVIYGASTMFVYSTGSGVHGFTLDPEFGEYVLSHENIRIPDVCTCFSANERNYPKWDDATRRFVDHIRSGPDRRYAKTSSRYVGTAVADFHRNLLYGGVFLYPADRNTGRGKLRLLYECAPFAMLAEQAGGLATTGRQRIMDVHPTELHQRVPFAVGNKREIELYERLVAEMDAKTQPPT